MSEKVNDDQESADKISRGHLLNRTLQLGAGAVIAGSLPSRAGATSRAAVPRRGGRITWALEADPGNIAPFGGLAAPSTWGNELMYDSLLEWDRGLNIHPALASGYVVKDNRTLDWTLKRGIKFSNGQEVTAADAKYSFDLQANPPLPGSFSATNQFPAIARTEVLSKYKLRMHLKAPDARVYGYLAWGRYSAIVPRGMYQNLNAAFSGIGTGPFKLAGPYIPNDRIEYVRNPHFWKEGLPYLDAITFKIMVDEQARIAALRTGAIDGATVSSDTARSLRGVDRLRVLSGLTAAFRELGFTVKAGENKPWADQRVRQAINHAINRQDIINRIYNGDGQYTGHIPAGFGPWPLSQKELKEKYEKFDIPAARKLMADAGFAKGFKITLKTASSPVDMPAVAALIQNQLKSINIDVSIVAVDPATYAADFGGGRFEMQLVARGMRGDPDGFVAEFNPSSPITPVWFSGGPRNVRAWRLIGNGRITLDTKKRLPMYKELNKILLTTYMLHVPLISVSKYQVVNARLQGMYVAFTDFNPGLRTAYLAR